MAELKPCVTCGKPVSTGAATCPHCGEGRPTVDKKAEAKVAAKGCLIILVLLVGAVAVMVAMGSRGRHGPPGPDVHGAWAYATMFVQQQLKNPNSADFGDQHGGDTTVTVLGPDTFEVRGWVDATNSFGGKVRSDWTMKIQRINGGWRAIDGPHLLGR